MRIINTSFPTNDTDPVRTEYTIYKNLKYMNIPQYILVNVAIADLLNISTDKAQSVIDEITGKQNRNYIFICQHIRVNEIEWYGNIVCTPHSTIYDNFISIPHYTINTRKLSGVTRDKLFSFTGWAKTHPIREKLIKMYPDYCKSINNWGVIDGDNVSYLDELERSEFALCPRGTGVSSIRLFEAMSMGCIPVIIADDYDQPLRMTINWNEFAIFIPECSIDKIPKILSSIDSKTKRRMRNKVIEVYNTYFDNDVLGYNIVEHLNWVGV